MMTMRIGTGMLKLIKAFREALSTMGGLAHDFSSSQTSKHGSTNMITFDKRGN